MSSELRTASCGLNLFLVGHSGCALVEGRAPFLHLRCMVMRNDVVDNDAGAAAVSPPLGVVIDDLRVSPDNSLVNVGRQH